MDEKKRPPRTGTQEYIIKSRTTQERLRTITGRIDMPQPMWRRLFVENGVYKGLALVFTLMLFFIVRQDKTKVLPININVVVTNQHPGVIITNHDQIPKKLKVRVKGRWSDLTKALQKQPFTYPLDLKAFDYDATVKFDLEKIKRIIGIPGLSVQSISPPTFTVKVAPKKEKFVNVTPVLKNHPPKGYKLDKKSLQILPAKVKVWGIKEDVDKVKELFTRPVDLSRINRTMKIDIPIKVPDIRGVYLDAKSVKLNIPVVPVMGKRKLRKVAIEVTDCPEGYACTVRPRFATVYLKGPEPALMDLDSGRFAHGLTVDAGDFDPEQSVYRGVSPNCERPESVHCKVVPRSVMLKFVKIQNTDSGSATKSKGNNKKNVQTK